MSVFINDIMSFSFLGEGLLFAFCFCFFVGCTSSIYIFLISCFSIDSFLLLLCTTTIVNGVYCWKQKFLHVFMKNWWLIYKRDKYTKDSPLSSTSGVCVTVLWGLWDVCVFGAGDAFFVSSPDDLAAASSLVTTPEHLTCRIPSDPPKRGGSRRSTMRELNFERRAKK